MNNWIYDLTSLNSNKQVDKALIQDTFLSIDATAGSWATKI